LSNVISFLEVILLKVKVVQVDTLILPKIDVRLVALQLEVIILFNVISQVVKISQSLLYVVIFCKIVVQEFVKFATVNVPQRLDLVIDIFCLELIFL